MQMARIELGRTVATARIRRRWRQRIVPLHRVDAALLDFADMHWRKVARVIGDVWIGLSPRHRTSELIDRLAQRVARLVAAGQLEVAGDLRQIRFSEVRLPRAAAERRQGK